MQSLNLSKSMPEAADAIFDAVSHRLGDRGAEGSPAQPSTEALARLEKLLIDSDVEGYFRSVHAETGCGAAITLAALAGLAQIFAPAVGPHSAAAARELLLSLADQDFVARGGEPSPAPAPAPSAAQAAPSSDPASTIQPQRVRTTPSKLPGGELGAVLAGLEGSEFDRAFDRLIKSGR